MKKVDLQVSSRRLSSLPVMFFKNLLSLFLFLLFLYGNVGMIESAIEEEGISQCNPSTKQLFGRFFLQRYFDAREELGMENLKVRLPNKLI